MFGGLIYQLVYKFERHRLLRFRLLHWLIFPCLVLPLALWLGVWVVDRLAATLITLGAVGIVAVAWWTRRQLYVRFVEQTHDQVCDDPHREERESEKTANQQPTDTRLPDMSKFRVHATGFFEVGGKRRYFVETPADYTIFETREHCVMAQIPISRFLLVAKSSQDAVGWWYNFFQPASIRSVNSGCLYFGLRPRPALRLEIALPDDSKEDLLYLSFDDEETRLLVLADLKYEADLG